MKNIEIYVSFFGLNINFMNAQIIRMRTGACSLTMFPGLTGAATGLDHVVISMPFSSSDEPLIVNPTALQVPSTKPCEADYLTKAAGTAI